jgi:cell division FtsZ-interacting protein ZapD
MSFVQGVYASSATSEYTVNIVAQNDSVSDDDVLIDEMNTTILQPYLLKIDKSFIKIDNALPNVSTNDRSDRLRVLTDLLREIDRAEKLLKARTDISSIRRDILQKVYQHMQRRTNELIIKTQ